MVEDVAALGRDQVLSQVREANRARGDLVGVQHLYNYAVFSPFD